MGQYKYNNLSYGCTAVETVFLGRHVMFKWKTIKTGFRANMSGLNKNKTSWRVGGSVSWAPDLGSGHDLAVRGFEPHIGLCADSSEPRTCFRFCDSLSLSAPPTPALCLSLKKKHKTNKKKKEKNKTSHNMSG